MIKNYNPVMRCRIVSAVLVVFLGLTACGPASDSDAALNQAPGATTSLDARTTSDATASPDEPEGEFLLQTLPIDLAKVDWQVVMQHADLYDDGKPISDFGDIDGAGTGNERRNPQPTFFVPLGTVVVAPVDGVVVYVPQLYSGDYSIHIGRSAESNEVWETEHVENVLVKKGDVVKAGQPVATVSDYSCYYSREKFGNEQFCGKGIGLVELGYLVGGAKPRHYCPFGELTSPSALAKIEAALSAARAEIERLAGRKLFDTSSWAAKNCVIADAVEG